jgi:hypothetical protein
MGVCQIMSHKLIDEMTCPVCQVEMYHVTEIILFSKTKRHFLRCELCNYEKEYK